MTPPSTPKPLRAGPVQSREQILRDEVQKVIDNPDYTNPEGMVRKLREALEQADEIKEDRKENEKQRDVSRTP